MEKIFRELLQAFGNYLLLFFFLVKEIKSDKYRKCFFRSSISIRLLTLVTY